MLKEQIDGLKTCPFCGRTDVSFISPTVHHILIGCNSVCKYCESRGPQGLGCTEDKAIEDAKKQWNNRTIHP